MTRWADRCVVSRAAKSWAQSGYQESYGDFVLNYKGYGKGFQPREYEEMSPAQRRQIGEAEALEAAEKASGRRAARASRRKTEETERRSPGTEPVEANIAISGRLYGQQRR